MADDLVRSSSAQLTGSLFRNTSAALGGGASVLPPSDEGGPSERTPLQQGPARQLSRQQTTRRLQGEQTQDEVAQQLVEEIYGVFARNWIKLLLGILLVIALVIITMVFFFIAVVAVINNHEKKCDQPLKWYLLVSFCWGQIMSRLHTFLAANSSTVQAYPITSALFFSASGWLSIAWGLYMVFAAKTCPETNPGLYYPTFRYIICQLVVMVFFLILAIISAAGMRNAMLLINRLITQQGCEAAVHEFPKVKAGDPELVSPEDGEVFPCPICMEDLNGAVRTPCDHLFHEECLATWCKNHLTCPLCREQLAAPDGESGKGMTEP